MSTSLHGQQLVLVVVVLLLTAGRGLKTWSVVVTTRKQSLLLHHHPHHPQVKLLTTLYMSEQVIDTRWRDCLQNSLTGNATNFKEAMGVLKTQHGLAKHWSSTVLEPTQVIISITLLFTCVNLFVCIHVGV